jgi:hypothetical protein
MVICAGGRIVDRAGVFFCLGVEMANGILVGAVDRGLDLGPEHVLFFPLGFGLGPPTMISCAKPRSVTKRCGRPQHGPRRDSRKGSRNQRGVQRKWPRCRSLPVQKRRMLLFRARCKENPSTIPSRVESSVRRSSIGQSHSDTSRPADARDPATLPCCAVAKSSSRAGACACSTRVSA